MKKQKQYPKDRVHKLVTLLLKGYRGKRPRRENEIQNIINKHMKNER